MFCTRCKRTSHYRSRCRAKTFKGGQTRIGANRRYSSYSKKKPYRGKRY